MSEPVPLPPLRAIAALSPRDAKMLLVLAEHSYRLHTSQSARQCLRRIEAYRRFLKLSPARDEPESGTANSSTVAEHRRAPRQDLFRLGELHPAGWSYPIDCLVREASANGALVEVGHTTDLPDVFTLTIQSTGLTKRCQVVRRTERCLGVAFTTA
jgi:hypothetical protein